MHTNLIEYLLSDNQIRVSNDMDWHESDLLLKWEKSKLKDTQSAIGQMIIKIEIIYIYEKIIPIISIYMA